MWKDEAGNLDMLNACRRIERYAQGIDGVAFLGGELRQDAIVRQLTILGEAAKRVSPGYRRAHPVIPWQQIASFRDVVVHQYERMDLPRVWQIVTAAPISRLSGLPLRPPSLCPMLSHPPYQEPGAKAPCSVSGAGEFHRHSQPIDC